MKRSVLFLICFFTCSLFSEENEVSYWDLHPWRIGSQIIRIGKADCSNAEGNVHYRKSNLYTTVMVPINPKNFFFPRIEMNYVTFDWNQNPKFNETHFYYLQASLAYYSTGLEDWRWIGRFDYNLQTEHLSHPGRYGLYSGILWGAHQIHHKWRYHIGFLGYGGLEGSTIYPIIGFDWTPNGHWFLQALFPINYSIEYSFDESWTLAIKTQPLKERLRVGSREPQPRSIFNYSSTGTELNLQYEYKNRLTAEIYGGINYGGKFYIKDARGKNALYVKFESAPFFGAKIDFGF